MLDSDGPSHAPAEDTVMGFPALCLHHLHFRDQDSCPAPLQLGGPEAAPTDIQALLRIAESRVLASNVDSASCEQLVTHRVSLGGTGIIIEELGGEGSWQIPLYFSEVALFEATSTFVVVGLRENSHVAAVKRLQGPFRAAWIIRVEHDEAIEGSDSRLLNLLSTMGALGAVRSDLAHACEVDMTPIGSGGCSTVYLGHPRRCSRSARLSDTHSDEDEQVAIKVLIQDPSKDSSYMAIAEAALLMGSTRHPNIIGFHGLFKQPDLAADGVMQWVMMLEYCSCGDLHDDLSFKGPVGEMRAAELMFGLLSALGHLHAEGIVHRDVKSENILLKTRSHAVLSDFGIAARLDDEQAMTKRCGSPGYCAPEILNSQRYGAKVDVFSAGVVLYFILSAQLPFAGPDIASVLRRTLRCRVKLEANYFGRLSLRMKTLIMDLLQKEVETRIEASAAFEKLRKDYSGHLEAQEALLSSKAAPIMAFDETSKEKRRLGRSWSHASTATPKSCSPSVYGRSAGSEKSVQSSQKSAQVSCAVGVEADPAIVEPPRDRSKNSNHSGNSQISVHSGAVTGEVPNFWRSSTDRGTWSGSICDSWTSTPSGREDCRESREERDSFNRDAFDTCEEGVHNQCLFEEAYSKQREVAQRLRCEETSPTFKGVQVTHGRRYRRFPANTSKPGPAAQTFDNRRSNVVCTSGPDEGAGPFRPEDPLMKMWSDGADSAEEGRPSFESKTADASSSREPFRRRHQDHLDQGSKAKVREPIISRRCPQDEAGGPEVTAISPTETKSPTGWATRLVKADSSSTPMQISPPASVPPMFAAARMQRYKFANQEQASGDLRRVYVPLFKRRKEKRLKQPNLHEAGDEGRPSDSHREQEETPVEEEQKRFEERRRTEEELKETMEYLKRSEHEDARRKCEHEVKLKINSWDNEAEDEASLNRGSWSSWPSEASASSRLSKESCAGQRLTWNSGSGIEDDEPRNSKGSRATGFSVQFQEPILEDRSTFGQAEMEEDMQDVCLQEELLAEAPISNPISNPGARQSFPQRIFPRASVARSMLGWRRGSAGRRSTSASAGSSQPSSTDTDAIGQQAAVSFVPSLNGDEKARGGNITKRSSSHEPKYGRPDI